MAAAAVRRATSKTTLLKYLFPVPMELYIMFVVNLYVLRMTRNCSVELALPSDGGASRRHPPFRGHAVQTRKTSIPARVVHITVKKRVTTR